MRFFSLRGLFLLGFIVAMPVLALPSVGKRIDEWLYGPPPSDFGRAPVPPPITEEPMTPLIASPVVKSSIAPARFDEPSPAPQNLVQPAQLTSSFSPAAVGNRYEAPSPPALAPTPPFATPEVKGEASPEPKIDERTIARLQLIRDRLEQLGAEYVLVDTQDSGRFRFHCRMLVDPRTRYTRPFDAASFDPIAAGEQVLAEVERWRSAAATIPANPTR
jgi:hypothetical protein